jgi:hypothetical protein
VGYCGYGARNSAGWFNGSEHLFSLSETGRRIEDARDDGCGGAGAAYEDPGCVVFTYQSIERKDTPPACAGVAWESTDGNYRRVLETAIRPAS